MHFLPFCVIVLILCFIPGFPVPCAAQEQEEAETLIWTESMNWSPPEHLLAGIRKFGVLKTGREGEELVSPQFVRFTGGQLIVADPDAKRLFLFTADGIFLKSLPSGSASFPSFLNGMAADARGRILLGGSDKLLLFDGDTVQEFQNYQMVGNFDWDGETIFTLNRGERAHEEGLLREVDHQGTLKAEWGDASHTPFTGRYYATKTIARDGDRLLVMDDYLDGFLIIDPKTREVRVISFAIPAFRERFALMQRSVAYTEKNDLNTLRIFPTMTWMEACGGHVYLLLNDRQFLTIIQARQDGVIESVWRGRRENEGYARYFTVALVEGKPRFYLLMQKWIEDRWENAIHIYVPDATVPTMADFVKVEQKIDPAEKAKYEESRKIYNEFSRVEALARKTDDPVEKRKILFDFVEKHPTFGASPHFLRSAAGQEPDAALVADVLARVEAALPLTEDPNIRTDYLILRAGLLSRTDDRATLEIALDEALVCDLNTNDVYQICVAAKRAKVWDRFLAAAEQGLSMATPEKLKEMYRSVEEERLTQMIARLRAEFSLLRGEALLGAGRAAEALTDFETAGGLGKRNFIGGFDGELGIGWAEALYATGRHEEALDMAAVETLFSRDPQRMALLRVIHAAARPGEDFDAWERAERLRRAPTLPDATFHRYGGGVVPLRSTLGKVTLINFWSPST